MTSTGCEEMLSPWEQPLVGKSHSLQKYFVFICATLTDFCETCNKTKIFATRHVTGVFSRSFFFFPVKLFPNPYDMEMRLELFGSFFLFYFFF